MCLRDDLEGAPQFRRRGAEHLFHLLQPLAEGALFLAKFLDALGAGPRPGLQLALGFRQVVLQWPELFHRGPQAIDQVTDDG